ncbi:hypothetical protein OH456_06845 [Vibrio sp. La 4.2.2]|uniref:hypothetical protein n=1 Tax=Vibrio sp. La 4.2.2 TaxID=2998830 RepID=UPI0022CE170C|nr:hypothetical protein [Vibrio sp. La 4.2.2]MDA0107853.1 hypothetical protein [Vibrio sp. La 4.2.2]
MEYVMGVLDDTFNKSSLGCFQDYVRANSRYKKFLIFSDYCLHDKNKPNDVVSFTIVPYDEYPEILKKKIRELAPRDIKKTRKVNPEFINYLNQNRFFHVSFILGSRGGLTKNCSMKEVDYINESIDVTKSMLNDWAINTPSNREYFDSIVKKLNYLKNEQNKKSPNRKLLRDVLLVPMLASYLAYLLTKEAQASIIGWFSDRDKIIESYNEIAYDFFHINHHSFCEKAGINSSDSQIVVGQPTCSEGGMWYDAQNRLPDHIAGTIADWSLPDNKSSKQKFISLIENLLADNNNCILIKLDLKVGSFSCSRLEVKSQTCDSDL